MGLETGTYISDLVSTNPTASDAKSQGDDHIRLLKSTVKATFPNVSGAVTPTHTELNFVDGVTSAIQTQIDTKGAITGQTWTGNHIFPTQTQADNSTKVATTAYVDTLGATKAPIASPTFTGVPSGPTATAGTSTTQLATTAFVAATSFSTNLPGQTSNSGKFLTTDGTNASWATTTISKSYTSGQQAITASGSFTLAHSLGAMPTVVIPYLECTSTSIGYTTGQFIPLDPSNTNGSVGIALACDATNIYGKIGGSGLAVLDLSTGLTATPSNANFKLVVRAWL